MIVFPLLGFLLLACASFAAWPLVRFSPDPLAAQPDLVEALEERDRALAALRELEFDHRAGTILDNDYRELVGSLRLRAAEALKQVDRYA